MDLKNWRRRSLSYSLIRTLKQKDRPGIWGGFVFMISAGMAACTTGVLLLRLLFMQIIIILQEAISSLNQFLVKTCLCKV